MPVSIFSFATPGRTGDQLRIATLLLFLGVLPLGVALFWTFSYQRFRRSGEIETNTMRQIAEGINENLRHEERHLKISGTALSLVVVPDGSRIDAERINRFASIAYSGAGPLRAIEWRTPSGQQDGRATITYARGSVVREGLVVSGEDRMDVDLLERRTNEPRLSASSFYTLGGNRERLFSVGIAASPAGGPAGYFVCIYDSSAFFLSRIKPPSGDAYDLIVSDGTDAIPQGSAHAFAMSYSWDGSFCGHKFVFTLVPRAGGGGYFGSSAFWGGLAGSLAFLAFVVMAYVALRSHHTLALQKAHSDEVASTRESEHHERLAVSKRQLAAQQMLEISSVSSQIAHEIRNKLTPAKSLPSVIEALLPGIQMNERERSMLVRFTSMAKESVRSVEVILQALTSLGRSTTDEPRLTAVAPAVLTHVSWKAVLSSVQESAVTLRVIHPPDDKILLAIDYGLGMQAMVELLKNSIDACKLSNNEPREIEVSYFRAVGMLPAMVSQDFSGGKEPDAPWGVIKLRDNGCGIDSSDLHKVFQPTFSTKDGDARGLGMCFVSEIMSIHRGAITISSQLNRGTSISLYFRITDHVPRNPVKAEDIGATAGFSESAPDSFRVAGTALIVDDEEVVRDILADILHRHGVETIEVSSGEDAMALLLNGGKLTPDMVFLDHRLGPGIGGVSVANELRGRGPWVLIHCSATLSQDQTPVNELCLPKPFGPEEVSALLRRYQELKFSRKG